MIIYSGFMVPIYMVLTVCKMCPVWFLSACNVTRFFIKNLVESLVLKVLNFLDFFETIAVPKVP